ncbi:pre-mRNA-splicing factor cwc22 [Sphaerosporella brunnea]|uniref:Pre-mRNA-splicing factor CWC22 n=1 Tax=Sphaerosporella brunnea TaxID=1250544 RepID=A0A5J5F8Q6_9PEZI|nr:pre-mRNA-splicing factor cwc22 [Sphaerosporella brunnea]
MSDSGEEEVVVKSVVRLPSPPPPNSTKRKRSPRSRSPSPRRYRSPPRGSAQRPQRPQRDAVVEEKPKFDAKAEYEKLLNMRSGGTYIPPARLRALQAQITDKSSKEYQRMAWEALKKSINGLVNKVNTSNIKHIVPELFGENLIRGRGLYCRSIMKAQAASLPFTPIYAAMSAIVNTKLPQVGELLLNRLVVQFRKAFKRNDKAVCLSSTTFIAHLCNQQVAHEILVIEILMLLLNKPTDDSVEIAVGLVREVGAHLEEMSPRANNAVFEQFRTILHEANIDKRVQYMIEVLFQVRKEKYKDNPPVREELDLVEEEDQITHRTDLDDEIDVMDGLNIFKFDPNWEEHEALYAKTKAEILGEGSEDEDEDEEEESSDEEDEEKQEEKRLEIKDQSNTNLVNLRRTIYLTIMSSVDFEECCHKLMKINLPAGQELELCSMIIECCSQERTYSKFYGLIGERFAKLNRLWTELFEESFRTYYDTIHRYETNRLRNIAKFFGHMLASDALGWHLFRVVHLNEEETTASSRIFIKILFQDLAEAMGMKKLVERLKDPYLQEEFASLFPKDNPRNTRFSINYFTSIGMGQITEDMREHLKASVAQQQAALEAAAAAKAAEESDNESTSSRSSYASYSSRSRSYSRSRSPRGRSYTRSPSYDSRDRSRSKSYDSRSSRSRSYSSSRSRSRSRSPSPARGTGRGRRRSSEYSRSRSPSYSRSRTRSASPRDKKAGRGRSYSRSVTPRRRSYSPSVTPPGKGKGKAVVGRGGRGRSRSRSASYSRSRSPTPASPPPPRKRRASPPPQQSRRRYSPSRSRSRSPPRRDGRAYRDRNREGGRVRAADFL